MDDDKIREKAKDITTKLNGKYPGIISEEVVSLFLSDLYSSEYSTSEIDAKIDESVARVVKSYTGRKNRNRDRSLERQYDLNEMFNCRIMNDTLHIHVVSESVKEDIAKLGLRGFMEFSEERLRDAFGKISGVIQLDENLDVQNIFAVSPLLKVSAVQALFRKYGFDAGMTKNEKFMEMFGTRKVGQALISRDKFLEMAQANNLSPVANGENSAKTEEDSAKDSGELQRMISESRESSMEQKQEMEQKSDNKVLVKEMSSNNSGEGGYGTVLGVVLSIISVSFILAGLILGLLS